MDIKTDLDLPPAYRTEANLWKAKYLEARRELVKANKGIYRLRKKLDRALQPTAASDGESFARRSRGAREGWVGRRKVMKNRRA